MNCPACAEPVPASPGAASGADVAADVAADVEASGEAVDAGIPAPVGAADLHPLARVLNAVNELAVIPDVEDLLKSAVLLARDGLGLERAVLFARDPTPRVVRLRGAWGIGADGQLTDARGLLHECRASEHTALLHLHHEGRLWRHYSSPALDGAPWLRPSGTDWGWVVATPLIAGRRLIGIFYNGGERHVPVDERKQLELAILCGCLGVQLLPRQHRLAWNASEPPGPRSAMVEQIRRTINETPALRGSVLAARLGLSSGHLARTFKREAGVSLVEYRQRVLLERFFAALDRGHTRLLDAATEAGFGSYAQFHRVYRKLMGAAPYESLSQHAPAGMVERAPVPPGPRSAAGVAPEQREAG